MFYPLEENDVFLYAIKIDIRPYPVSIFLVILF